MPKHPYICQDTLVSGTDNLSQYDRIYNLCDIDLSNITMPGVKLSHFHVYNITCPFDTLPVDNDSAHLVRNINRLSSNYWGFEVAVPPYQRVRHYDTGGIMIKWNRGSKYGWLCVDDNCPYYNGITVEYDGEDIVISQPGQRYFYI